MVMEKNNIKKENQVKKKKIITPKLTVRLIWYFLDL